jgi:hypothetical protein
MGSICGSEQFKPGSCLFRGGYLHGYGYTLPGTARRAEPRPVQDPRHRWIMNTLPVTVKFVVPSDIGNGGLDWNAWKLSATGISRTSK